MEMMPDGRPINPRHSPLFSSQVPAFQPHGGFALGMQYGNCQ